MRIVHNDLSADLPDAWTDCSTVLYVGPVSESNTGAPTFSLSVVETNQPPKRVALDHIAKVKSLTTGMRILRDGPFTTKLGEGWHFLTLLPAGPTAAYQLIVTVARENDVVMASATAPEASFAQWEPQLNRVLASLGPSPALAPKVP